MIPFQKNTAQRSVTSRKLNNSLNSLKAKIFNLKNILKFLTPGLIVFIITPIALVYTVNITYQRRTIRTPQEIPLELRTGVLMIRQEDILYRFEDTKELIEELRQLYSQKRITQIYIVSYNDNPTITPSIDLYTQFFKDIPSDNYQIDVSTSSAREACLLLNNKYQENKFILTSFKDLLPIYSYICSFKNIYVKPYLPTELEFDTEEDTFRMTLTAISESLFTQEN